MSAHFRPATKKLERHNPQGIRRVLLAQEDERQRERLANVLRQKGYAVTEVEDGSEAQDYLKWAANQPGGFCLPSVIVAQAEMSGGDGLDLLAYLRERHDATPVIVLNSMGEPDIERAARGFSATFVLDGPVETEELQAAVYLAVTTGKGLSSAKKSTESRHASSSNFEVPENAHTSTINASRNASGESRALFAADSRSLS